jgi:hypothetical protein
MLFLILTTYALTTQFNSGFVDLVVLDVIIFFQDVNG